MKNASPDDEFGSKLTLPLPLGHYHVHASNMSSISPILSLLVGLLHVQGIDIYFIDHPKHQLLLTESETESNTRMAEIATERANNGVEYTFNPIIPKDEVGVGCDLLGRGAGSMVWSGVYNGAKVAVKKAWAEQPEEDDFQENVKKIRL